MFLSVKNSVKTTELYLFRYLCGLSDGLNCLSAYADSLIRCLESLPGYLQCLGIIIVFCLAVESGGQV